MASTAATPTAPRTQRETQRETQHELEGPRGVFRHHEAPAPMASPLLRQLCQEWVEVHASSEALAAMSAWAETHPAMAGLKTPGELVDRIDAASRPDKDAILHALLELLQDGEKLAGRVLLQAMLPAVCDLTRRCPSPRGENAGYEENLHRVLAEFWTVVSQPRRLARPGVAGRLVLDTLNRVTRHRRSSDAWEGHTRYLQDGYDTVATAATEPALQLVTDDSCTTSVLEDLDPAGGLLELLIWARRTGVLTGSDAGFLSQVFLSGDADQKVTAERLGLPHAGVRQRVTRLRTRLVEAVVAEATSANHIQNVA